jgi:hypothetical protein
VKAPDCTRGLLVETTDTQYPYFLIGGGFLVSFREVGIFITAKHVITRQSPESSIVFPIGTDQIVVLRRQGLLEGDKSYQDLAYYPYLASSLDMEVPGWRPIALDLTFPLVQSGQQSLVPDAELCVVGIPQETRSIDWESGRIDFGTVELLARYDQPDSNRDLIHRAHVVDGPDLASYAGLSGSPVFSMTPPYIGLAGCVIEASAQSGIIHFIDSRILWNAAQLARNHTLGGEGAA